MKTLVYFILTCFVSTGAFFAATNLKNPWPAFAVAFGIWSLFFWGWYSRLRRETQRRDRERMFNDFMRSQSRRRY